MPLLCADIGNSHTTIGVVDDGEVFDHWRVATDERRTADEWAVLLRGLLRESTVADRLQGGLPPEDALAELRRMAAAARRMP